jgi:hypothetical protein
MTRYWDSDTLEKTETPTPFSLAGGRADQSDLSPYLRTLHFLVSFPIALAVAALLRRALDGPSARRLVLGLRLRPRPGRRRPG